MTPSPTSFDNTRLQPVAKQHSTCDMSGANRGIKRTTPGPSTPGLEPSLENVHWPAILRTGGIKARRGQDSRLQDLKENPNKRTKPEPDFYNPPDKCILCNEREATYATPMSNVFGGMWCFNSIPRHENSKHLLQTYHFALCKQCSSSRINKNTASKLEKVRAGGISLPICDRDSQKLLHNGCQLMTHHVLKK